MLIIHKVSIMYDIKIVFSAKNPNFVRTKHLIQRHMKKYFLLAASVLAAILTFSACNDKPDETKPDGPKKEGYVTDAQGRRLISRIIEVEENPFYSTEFPITYSDSRISYDDKFRPLKIEQELAALTEISDENDSSRKPKTSWDNSGEYIQIKEKATTVFSWADKSVTITQTMPDWEGGHVTTSLLFHLNENGLVDFYEKDSDDDGMGYRQSYTYDAEGYLQTITTEYENGRREQESISWKNGHVADEFIHNKANRSNYDFEKLRIPNWPFSFFNPASFDLFGKTPSGYRSYDDFFQYNKVPTKYEFDEEGFLKGFICTGNHAEDFPTPQTYKQSYSYLEY